MEVDFRTENITRSKEYYFIIIKGATDQEDILILSADASNKKEQQNI